MHERAHPFPGVTDVPEQVGAMLGYRAPLNGRLLLQRPVQVGAVAGAAATRRHSWSTLPEGVPGSPPPPASILERRCDAARSSIPRSCLAPSRDPLGCVRFHGRVSIPSPRSRVLPDARPGRYGRWLSPGSVNTRTVGLDNRSKSTDCDKCAEAARERRMRSPNPDADRPISQHALPRTVPFDVLSRRTDRRSMAQQTPYPADRPVAPAHRCARPG